jgi:circadian clock protein KaiC
MSLPQLPKALTGIDGLDEITEGGLPLGRPTLVCGSAGCGKTLMGVEFLVRGAINYQEPGVLMAFEETVSELVANVTSLGFDLPALQAQGLLRIDHVHVDRSEIEETGEYDLEGLFIRLGHAIDSIGAKRVVLDTIEALFSGFPNQGVLRSEIRRLFRWLKDKGVTTIITAERGEGTLTRQGLEEYVSDCVILLDNRVIDQITTRRLRIVKYRGSTHGTNEYPYLISDEGISVLPVTSLALQHECVGPHRVVGHSGVGRHVWPRRLLRRQQRADNRHGGHRQNYPGRRFCQPNLPLWPALLCFLPLKNPPSS